MDKKIYTITLADGTVIPNLSLNGNNYISSNPVEAAVFSGNCSPVVINDGLVDEVHDNMDLVQITEFEGKYWFVLRDLSPEELILMKIQSDIEYTAMMAGIEL